MKRPAPKVGDTLFSLNINNNAARNRGKKLTPVVVKKVGRLYFYAGTEGFKASDRKYSLKDWSQVSEYMADSKLYPTAKEWLNEDEANRIYKDIFGIIERRKGMMSLADLKNIKHILDNPTW
jgi:hypothetical protein